MATVVNARDVLLQATSPRVATVTIAGNLTVDQSQVNGLGLIVAGSKLALLDGTAQVFQVAKNGTVSPSQTILAATVRNIAGTPSLTVVAGTISPAPTLEPDLTCTIAESALVTDSATLRLSITEDGTTYSDDFTICKVREGIDALNGLLTNETCSLPGDSLGNVTNYAGAGGTFKVFQGATDVTGLCSFAIVSGGNPQGLTVSINAANGVYSVTGGYPNNVTNATVTFRATFGANTIDKVFTVTKATSGSNGARGSMTFYVALSGSTAVWSDSLATTTVTAQGGPILNDTVTQYNNSQNFSETRFWSGSAWSIVNAVVDGNLLVSGTIGATKMATNLLQSDNVLTRGLTVRDGSGNIILSSGQALSSTYILDAAITSAKIANTIQSSNFSAGSAGWQINKTGGAEFNQITVRGTITASDINSSHIRGGSYTGYAWPAPGGSGFYLGPEGLLLGSAADGRYFQVEANGNIHAPQFDISGGVANFYGALQAASGTFSGTLTASAVNAVNTINIAGEAVTVPRAATSGAVSGNNNYRSLTSVFVPSGFPVIIMATVNVAGTGSATTTWANVRVWNGGQLGFSSGSTPGISACSIPFMYLDTSGNGGTYTLEFQSDINNSATGTIVAIGVKR